MIRKSRCFQKVASSDFKLLKQVGGETWPSSCIKHSTPYLPHHSYFLAMEKCYYIQIYILKTHRNALLGSRRIEFGQKTFHQIQLSIIKDQSLALIPLECVILVNTKTLKTFSDHMAQDSVQLDSNGNILLGKKSQETHTGLIQNCLSPLQILNVYNGHLQVLKS